MSGDLRLAAVAKTLKGRLHILKQSRFFRLLFAAFLSLAFVFQGTWALAGTTGALNGTLTDSTTGKPVGDATIVALSSSQTATAKTDASGHFSFLTLAPDTYTVSASKQGFAPVSIAGVTVFADQTYTLALTTQSELKTIARITSRAAGNLVKSGTTSDVYSVNAATQKTVQGIGGGYNLDSAYSAIYSQPGVQSQIGDYGFGQVFYVRGSSYSQVGYELDGIPVNRAFDNYNANSLSNFGTQQTEVYTGGSPAGGSSATLAGYINQVMKTGTFPGFGTVTGGLGAPAFYHKLSLEAGGATPNRLFSYYAGVYGANQDFRVLNNQNGGNFAPDGSNAYGLSGYSFNSVNTFFSNFYTQGPWSTCNSQTGAAPAGSATFAGLPSCNWYSPLAVTNLGWATNIRDRENLVNLHFGIPHKNDSGRDDVQLLFDNFGYQSVFGDSLSDNGGMANLNRAFNGWGGPTGYGALLGVDPSTYAGGSGPYADTCAFQAVFDAYAGTNWACATGSTILGYNDTSILAPGTAFGTSAANTKVVPYYQPGTSLDRLPNSSIPANLRDALWNNGSVVKLQYQKNLGSNAYARLTGYTFYSDWMQTSPNSAGEGLTAYLPGAVGGGYPSPDYELATHSRGLTLQFGDQLNAQNMLTFTGNYTTASAARTNNQFYAAPNVFTSFADASGNCYNSAGNPASCLSTTTQNSGSNLQPFSAAAGSPAALANAQWIVTRPAGYGPYNTIVPKFIDAALQDELRPNDKLDLNIGVRFERYQYDMANTVNPEFNFWFKAAAGSYCYDPNTLQPLMQQLPPGYPPYLAGPQVSFNNTSAHPGEQGGLCYHSNGTPWVNAAGNQYRHPNGQNGSLLFTNAGVPTVTYNMWSPRLAGTYTLNRNTVLRFSLGRYTQPTETAFMQYSNLSGYGAAKFDFTHFFGLGFLTPVHANPVQTSNNVDFSLEHQLNGTDMSFKISPFYRYTTNQLVTVALGSNFASGINAGTQKTQGVEVAFQKGDPSRNGLAGQVSYTYTDAKIKYSTLANGTNSVDVLNNYIISYNQLTSFCKSNPADARCGNMSATAAAAISPCYAANPGGLPANTGADCSAGTDITNPYYNAPVQGLLDRNGWYQTYANNPPYTAPGDVVGAFGPNTFAGWLNYKHDKYSVSVTAQLNQGALYGSPTAIIGLDPRFCSQNQATAGVVASGSPYAQNADYQSCFASAYNPSGYLAIPNPETGKFDSMGQYREPWQLNLGGQLSYDISPRINATLTLSNLVQTCFGGQGGSWTKAYKANRYDCGWAGNGGGYIGSQPGAGFFYGASGHDAANGTAGYPKWMDQPYAPLWGALPFQAYFQVQVKL